MANFELILSQWAPLAMFLLGAIGAMFVALIFNVATHRFVKVVQRLEESAGRDWSFWENRDRLFTFLFRPAGLIERDDSLQVVAAKKMLIAHRATMKKYVFLAASSLVVGCIGAIAVPVAIGILHS